MKLLTDDRGLLSCVHCGLCLASCPTYLETGDENDSPRGRIHLMRALQEDRLSLDDQVVEPIDRCLGCRACEAACPSGVPYGDLLENVRDAVERDYPRSLLARLFRRVFIEQVFPFAHRLELALLPASWIRSLGWERLMPKSIRQLLRLVPERFEAARLPEFSPAATRTSRGRIGFVSGCAMSALMGPTNRASVELLNRAGYDVVTPAGQSCCGALHAHGGRLNEARRLAKTNLRAFAESGCETIVINAAGCGSTLKEYGKLLEEEENWRQRGERFGRSVKDLSEFLAAAGLAERWSSDTSRNGSSRLAKRKTTYHDACHLAHAQGIRAAPRRLLEAVAGESLTVLPESDVCCGSAGVYNLTEPEMAGRLGRRKAQHIIDSGAEVVVTSNPGCIFQMRTELLAADAGQISVMHLADYLLQVIREREATA